MSQELLVCNFEEISNKNYYYYDKEGLHITSKGSAVWVYTPFILLPKVTYFEYDFIVSIEAQNQVYIQIERFNANKTSISNNAAINCIGGVKPSTNINYTRYKGQLNLATFGSGSSIQNTAYIKIRIGNNYNNTSGAFIIHNWSLKPVTNNINTVKILKNGQITTDLFRENQKTSSFEKKGFINSFQFYEY